MGMAHMVVAQNAIAHKIAIFSKSWCPHCRSAKELIAKEYKGEDVEILECVTFHFPPLMCLDVDEDIGVLQVRRERRWS